MARKIPDGLHDGIYDLLHLLSQFHSDSDKVSERDFHDLFESNEFIWKSMDYSEIISEPSCDIMVEYNIEGDEIEPDFLAYHKFRKRWEIVDLKLPLEGLTLKKRERRKRFKSKVQDYISQVNDYNDYFDESAHRDNVRSKHGPDIAKDPPVVLILGSNLDQRLIDTELKKFDLDISIIQYDNILDNLKSKYSEYSGDERGLPGFSIVSIIELTREPVNNRDYIIDIGQKLESNRASLYLQKENGLVLEVRSEESTSYDVSIPLGDRLEIDEPAILYMEIASSENMSFVRVFAGPEVLDEMIITAEIPIDLFDDRNDPNITLGANMEGEKNAAFLLGELMILSKVESLDNRLKLIDHLREKWDFD